MTEDREIMYLSYCFKADIPSERGKTALLLNLSVARPGDADNGNKGLATAKRTKLNLSSTGDKAKFLK